MKSEDDELLDVLEQCPPVGSLWLHYQGGVYQVTGRALMEKTTEQLVLYRSIQSPSLMQWARPLSQWREMVNHEGEWVPRFEPVA